MCEILAVSNRNPIPLNPWIEPFAAHSAPGSPHRDGSGIAYAVDDGFEILRDVRPAEESRWLARIRAHPIRSRLLLGHIRKATRGGLSMPNTQPFTRRFGGREHVFVHNGDLPGAFVLPQGECRAGGATDSERAFCHLVSHLAPLWRNRTPTVDERIGILQAFAERVRPLGPANFFYSDGEVLFVHGNRRTVSPGVVAPPGLHVFRPEGGEASDSHLIAVASMPVTDPSAWRPLDEGETFAILNGRIVEHRLAA